MMMAMGKPMTMEDSARQVKSSRLTHRPEDVFVVLVAAELLAGSVPCSRSLALGRRGTMEVDVTGITSEVATKGEQKESEWRPVVAMLSI
ncbi:hypothetical protein TYRP_014574 [Tyrophagus putrescentiae]|nr:hypothetical protein TYRP_014574 [Tyrophagus putrescentiae]